MCSVCYQCLYVLCVISVCTCSVLSVFVCDLCVIVCMCSVCCQSVYGLVESQPKRSLLPVSVCVGYQCRHSCAESSFEVFPE